MNSKQWKTAAHASVKKHYLLFLAVCLTAVMFNVEFGSLPSTVKNFYFSTTEGFQTEFMTILLQMANGTSIGHFLLKGYTVGLAAADTFQASFWMGLVSILIPLVQILLFIFFLQVIRVILRRVFLEARMYDRVPLSHTLYLVSLKKWAHIAIAMFEYALRIFLWGLTIIGGFIKYYSYFCAQFILAENPSLTSKQAIDLSRKMMDGHKKEAFLLDLSLIGWYLLSCLTFGIAGIFYTNAYITAVHTEFYASIRALAKEKQMEGSELLNDTYLFEKAEPALLATTYKSTKMDAMYIEDTEVPLHGAQKFFAEGLSLWIGSYKQRKVYQGVANLKDQLEKDQAALNGEQYPSRLNPAYTKESIHFDGNVTPDRAYSFTSVVLLFLFGSFLAWLMQGAYLVNGTTGALTKFGVLKGPWMPMFGVIGVLSLVLFTKMRKKPVAAFVLTALLAGVVEFLTAAMLAKNYDLRWWSYTNYYMNLDGKTCLQSVIAIALICMLFFYILAPLFDQWLSRKNPKIVLAAALILLAVFLVDAVLSYTSPNTAAGFTLFVNVTNLL